MDVFVSCLIDIETFIHNDCLDISGVPGTGKTATVHAVVRELKRLAEASVRSSLLLSTVCLTVE